MCRSGLLSRAWKLIRPPAGVARRLAAGPGRACTSRRQGRVDVSAIKVVAARLQTRVVNRAMQVFGAMGLSPDTPLAYFWTWGRAMHLRMARMKCICARWPVMSWSGRARVVAQLRPISLCRNNCGPSRACGSGMAH